jgi:uncharacterized protein YdeI (YjbR/CyaY-like superfamily)
VNMRRFEELEKQGLVHPSGRAAFEARDDARSRVYSYENRPVELDASRAARFRKHKAAWEFFQTQAPWYRRTAVHWVTSAKQEATRDRRLDVLIESSAKGERIPPFRRAVSGHPVRGAG